MIKETEVLVNSCYHSCPFFNANSEGMFCGHPHWGDKYFFDSMIITQDNSRGRVPDECPLKKEPMIIRKIIMYSSIKE